MFREIVSLEKAKRILSEKFVPKTVETEEVGLLDAYGRVLAEDVKAPFNVPSFNRSIVDGYAVRAEDTFGADEERPIKLKVVGKVNMGETPKVAVKQGEAVEVATGAALPEGADAVVMAEYSSRENNKVLIYRSVVSGENTMKIGDDIKKGEKILKKGEILGPRKIGVLAALGMAKVKVCKRPRVAIISTGPEIVEPGEPLPLGRVYDINSYTLSAAVCECGATAINLGIVSDEENKIEQAIGNALKNADAVITSGGVSVGPKDLIPKVLAKIGKPGIIVCGIAIKPGKPTTFAIIDGKPVFALPGQPTSALFVFYMFVRPILRRMAGYPSGEEHRSVKALVGEKMFPARGRRTFVMVSLKREDSGRLVAYSVPKGLSGAITTLAKADGYVEIPENRQFLDLGEGVTVHLFGN